MALVSVVDCGMLRYSPSDRFRRDIAYIPARVSPAHLQSPGQLVFVRSEMAVNYQTLSPTLSPTLGEFEKRAEVELDLTNVVKIVGLYEKVHNALKKHPHDDILKSRLRVVTAWAKKMLENYDDLSGDSRIVVDLFVKTWSSTLKLEGDDESDPGSEDQEVKA